MALTLIAQNQGPGSTDEGTAFGATATPASALNDSDALSTPTRKDSAGHSCVNDSDAQISQIAQIAYITNGRPGRGRGGLGE